MLDAEADTDAQADIQIHILPKLAPGAEMAARLTSAWLECSAQAYATLPQLHGSLSALLSAASNFIPIAGSSTALTTLR